MSESVEKNNKERDLLSRGAFLRGTASLAGGVAAGGAMLALARCEGENNGQEITDSTGVRPKSNPTPISR